ncbi:MAG: hypothetical protein HZB41_10820 [Ignavibacteriae bacterium]|nr:hypothetical protein [Ignavibacteriota bacterium]
MLLFEKNYANDPNKNNYTIDIQKYPQGIYYFVIRTGNRIETKSFFIIR